MLPEFAIIKSKCEDRESEELNFMQRKILNLLDIELSNKNPDITFNISCEKYGYSFHFFNGILEVKHKFATKEELFKRLEKFRESIKYLECDFSATNFLKENSDFIR